MDSSLARRAQEVLQAALDLEGDARETYVREACAGETRLDREVRSLLDAHDRAASFLERPAVEPPGRGLPAGTSVGRYTILSTLGAGGMGTVYLAMQSDPKRTVALKMLERSLTSRTVLQRFRHESEILARLDHPNVAQVYDAGTYDDGAGGVPYFAMEYVEGGRPITEYARQAHLAVGERLRLFATVCDAVHHGHQKGVIHRDLKPANVLVGTGGEPKIIDFGVARATDADLALTTLETNVGQLIGTLQYMSPEQCTADRHGIDTRSDVYTLGLLLYEMLCEEPPYDVSGAALVEAARMIREEPPVRPSTVNRTVRGDLETIVCRALAKERERRYASAAELGEEVRRFLRKEPILARPPSVMYHVGKFAQRHRALVAAGAASIVVLVAAAIVSAFFAIDAHRAEADTHAALDLSRKQAYAARIAASAASWTAGDLSAARRHLAATDPAERLWEHGYLARAFDESCAILLDEGTSTARAASADGRRLAVARDGGVRIIDIESRAIIRDHPLERKSPVALDPTGARLAYQREDRAIELVEVATGEVVAELVKHALWVTALAFSPDGRWLASASNGTNVALWDVGRFELLAVVNTGIPNTRSLAFSVDGRRLARGTSSGELMVLDVEQASVIAECRKLPEFRSVEFDAAGERILGAMGAELGIWSVPTLEPLARHALDTKEVRYATFDHGEETIVALLGKGRMALVDPATGAIVRDLNGGRPAFTFVARALDDALVTTERAVMARLWSTTVPPVARFVEGHTAHVRAMARDPGGHRLATADAEGNIRLWSLPDMGTIAKKQVGTDTPDCVALHPGGALVAMTGRPDRTLHLWDVETGAVVSSRQGKHRRIVFHPNGSDLLALLDGTRLVTLDARTLAERRTRDLPGSATSVAICADGSLIAVGGSAGEVWLLDASTDAALELINTLAGNVYSLAFSENLLAAGDLLGNIGLYDLAAPARAPRHLDLGTRVVDLVFDATGRRLVSTAATNLRTIWDTDSCQPLIELRDPEETNTAARAAAFGPEGHLLVLSTHRGPLWVHDSAPADVRWARLRMARSLPE